MTREFLKDGSEAVFDVDFDGISMSDLIPVEAVRNHIQDAERGLAAGDLNAGVLNAALAFESLMSGEPPEEGSPDTEWQKWEQRHRFNFDTSFFLKVQEPMGNRFAQAWDRVIDALTSNEFAIRLLSKGVSHDDYLRFESLTPTIRRMMGRDESAAFIDPGVQTTAEDVSWCIEFVIHAALAVSS